jgi:formylglycine-generating enzyme required for sulfatase activity
MRMRKNFMISDVPNLKKLQTSIFLLLLSSLLPAESDALTLKERQAVELEQLQKQEAEKIAKQQAKAKAEREQRARAKKAAEKQAADAEAKRLAAQEAEKQAAEAKRLADQAAETEKLQSIEAEMVSIKGGCFMMGSPNTERRGSDEKQHEVCVGNFFIGKYEVTQAQWQVVMGSNSSKFKDNSLPVEAVSFLDIQQFISRLNKKTGKQYRLPTEAEWEYAARAGTTTPFYMGNCINTDQANYDGNYDDYLDCGAKTGVYKASAVVVGSYPPNPWGLYDMAGNVWEWTCSAYDEDYSGNETKCTSDNDTTSQHVFRGGSWLSMSYVLRSAVRNKAVPDKNYSSVGFRLSRV